MAVNLKRKRVIIHLESSMSVCRCLGSTKLSQAAGENSLKQFNVVSGQSLNHSKFHVQNVNVCHIRQRLDMSHMSSEFKHLPNILHYLQISHQFKLRIIRKDASNKGPDLQGLKLTFFIMSQFYIVLSGM